MVKLELTFGERLTIEALLPKQSDLKGQLLAADIRGKVKVSSKELEDAKVMIVPQGGMRWDDALTKDMGRVIELTAAELQLLKDSVDEKDRKREISSDIVDLCVKIKGLSGDDKSKEDKE
jgi:hypothetical protein